ncbi:MAG: sulfatase-like hydrolase/transferase [Bacteroidales bacterium]|jgi:arylsulfatase A-like enzyme|nr:sulfatase-like hydrolase/transferase [Bacteroidales bacterium]
MFVRFNRRESGIEVKRQTLGALPVIQGCKESVPDKLPNILWITTEDNSPFLGCYGDSFATSPNLDKLASQGFLYTHAYANAPVSAPTRNTILTGIYACSGGHHHMRSRYDKSDVIRCYPELLRQAGYYCTNNSKEDYNINPEQTKDIWDESSKTAHYSNRKPGQPFFAVFNSTISHESSIHKSIPTEQLRHDPQKVKLPPYHPDTPEMRHDWAQYYDKIEDMDAWVGTILKELEESGEAENTIVIYYGDHGGVLPRSKRFTCESGTRVPFLVRIPEKYKYLYPAEQPGTKVDRLVSFVDLAPTLLSIVGSQIPEWMQGNAFLGKQKSADPGYVFMFRGRMDERYDMTRSLRDKQYRYIRNYMPHRIYGQHNNYQWQAPSMQSWERAFLAGQCNEVQSIFWNPKPAEELYDTENDPWEVRNLAGNPAYRETLERMRAALDAQVNEILDTGFIPEGEFHIRSKDMPLYDYMRSVKLPFTEIVETANLASDGDRKNLGRLTELLESDESIIRYWAATGLLILKGDAKSAIPQLEKALDDPSPDVAVVAAEALYNLGEKEIGIDAILKTLECPDIFVRNHALNALENTGEKSPKVQQAVISLDEGSKGDKNPMRYDLRMTSWLKEKWGIKQ